MFRKKKSEQLLELENEKMALEKENEYLKMRKMDVELYRKAYEKYVANSFRTSLTYDKLYEHPDYYTKWRNTFFDSQIRLIESGVFVERLDVRTDRTLTEIKELDERKNEYYKEEKERKKPRLSREEYSTAIKYSSACLNSPAEYELFLLGVCKFSELLLDENNPSKEPTYLDVDIDRAIVGYCDSVKSVDGKFQLHLTDPYGECLFPPFDITSDEAELALGRICVIYCAYNHYRKEPQLLELQILPFTLTEKLGEYTENTVRIRRSPEINYQRFPFL